MNHIFKICLFASTLICCCASDSFAQSASEKIDFDIESQQDPPTVKLNDLRNAMEALRVETQLLKDELSNPIQNNAGNSSMVPSSLQLPNSDTSEAPSFATPLVDASLGTEKTKDIYERIELLKRVYEQKKNAAAKDSTNLIPPNSTPPTISPPAPSVVNNLRNLQAPAEIPIAERTAFEIQENFEADQVLPQPVDPFELGNSLYQTDRIQAALETYASIDGSTITAAEAVWVDFMIASCHRRLGNWDDARSIYREVANQGVVVKLAQPAQSWLKQLDLVSTSKASFTEMEAQLDTILKKANDYVK